MDESPVIRNQLAVYGPAFARHGDGPDATFAGNAEAQALRFERILEPLLALGVPGFSIHEVGSGLSDLHGWLCGRGIEHRYSGTEIVAEMIDLVGRKYPGIRIDRRDVLAEMPADRHDFVVQSGMFNIPGETPEPAWSDFVWAMIERMYAMADAAIAFNFLSAYRTRSDAGLYYMDPRDVLDRCIGRLSRHVRLDHGYPLFEATVCVIRPEFLAARYDPKVFGKYFGPGTPRPSAPRRS